MVVFYLLPEPADAEIAFLDHAGEVIRTFSSAGADGTNDHAAGPAVTVRPGLNRFEWDMLYPAALSVPGDLATAGKPTSPHAPPGLYTVRLTVNRNGADSGVRDRQRPSGCGDPGGPAGEVRSARTYPRPAV